MIQLQQVSLQRGHNILLELADLTLHSGWKVGLVGANGAGKSSLFKLFLGELHCDSGNLDLPGGLRISHMAQEVPTSERSAIDYVLDGDIELRKIQQQLQTAEQEHQLHRIGELHAELDNHNGYNAESRAAQLLAGLGFSHNDITRSVKEFSGGWRIRLNLAQALMCPSDLLLLDEPTNHLDLDATIWLEQWLRQYPGMLILISHDRDFLDNVVSHITHVEHKKLHLYKGGYSAFELQRAERLAQQQAEFAKQQQRIGEIEDFVRRFRAKATKAKQAQSRIKELERMEKIAPAHVDSPFSFQFCSSDKMSSPLLTLSDAECGYETKTIIGKTSLSLTPGTRIGLLGPNGAGKSTTLGIVSSLVNKSSGHVSVFGIDQDEDLNATKLNLGVVPQEFNFNMFENVRDILVTQAGYYGIPYKKAEERADFYLKKLGLWDKRHGPSRMLSGGMKRRLMIARALMHEPKLLILDEPTAGVDIELRRSMWSFLQEINAAGTTIILTTHYLEEAESLCRNIAIIDHGQIVENTSMRELLLQLNTETFVFDIDQVVTEAPSISDYQIRVVGEHRLEVDVEKGQDLNTVFALLSEQSIRVNSMRNKSNRLEELFVALVDKNLQQDKQ
jgi:ATP-binding cassette subfamily F protein 3